MNRIKQAALSACALCLSALVLLAARHDAPGRLLASESRLSTTAGPGSNDLWGERLPAGALARMGAGYLRVPLGFRRVLFSPAGTSVWAWAIYTDGDQLHIWQYPRRKEMPVGRIGSYDVQRFAPDGAAVVCVERRPRPRWAAFTEETSAADIVLVDLASGRESRRFQGHKDFHVDVSFSGDGSRLLSAAPEKDAWAVRVWDTSTGKELRSFIQERVHWAIVSPHGDAWAAAKGKDTVEIWNAHTGKPSAVISLVFVGKLPKFKFPAACGEK